MPIPENWFICYRTAGERTESANLDILFDAFPDREIVRLAVEPFRDAVGEMLRIAGDRGVLAVDADVELTRPDLVLGGLEYPETTYWVQDRFRGPVPAGVHWHSAPVVREMRELFPSGDKKIRHAFERRPESALMFAALAKLGADEQQVKKAVGRHDHNQWYRDIWAKYLYRGWRDGANAARYTSKLDERDPEERVALLGIKDSREIPLRHYGRQELWRLFKERHQIEERPAL